MEQKTIRVMGVGNVKVAPDTTRLRFCVDSLHKDYETAYAEAAVGNKELRKALEKMRLPKDSLKTSDFSITKETEWKRKEEKWVFVGFKLRQTLARHHVKGYVRIGCGLARTRSEDFLHQEGCARCQTANSGIGRKGRSRKG